MALYWSGTLIRKFTVSNFAAFTKVLTSNHYVTRATVLLLMSHEPVTVWQTTCTRIERNLSLSILLSTCRDHSLNTFCLNWVPGKAGNGKQQAFRPVRFSIFWRKGGVYIQLRVYKFSSILFALATVQGMRLLLVM